MGNIRACKQPATVNGAGLSGSTITLKITIMETKTHWKALTHPDYIGAYALMVGDTSPDMVVTITEVKRELVTGADGKKEECSVAYLKNSKPMILNATNQKSISKALGSPYIQDWAGKSITLYVAKVKAFGDTVDALRVREKAPVIQLPELNELHKSWDAAKVALQAGNTTIDAIRKKYFVSPENEKLLMTVNEPAHETV